MYKKLLFPVLLFASLISYSQTYTEEIGSSGLPIANGQIHDVIDYNNDGWDDVLYNQGNGNLKLYKNTLGTFTDITNDVGLGVINMGNNYGVISFDYNNDGFQDILVTRANNPGAMRLFKNNCGISFVDVSVAAGVSGNLNILGNPKTNDPVVLVSDYDKDNDNDLIFTTYNSTNLLYSISVYINSNGVYTLSPLIPNFTTPVSPFISLIDYDNDLDDDIIVIRSSLAHNQSYPIELYESNGAGNYTLVSAFTGLSSSSSIGFVTIWDYNADGFSDLLLGTKEVVLPGSGNSGNKVFRNNGGDGTFTNVTASVNTYSSTNNGDNSVSHVFDAENDGDLDVFWQIDNPLPAVSSTPNFMINNGSNVFTPLSIPGIINTSNSNCRYTVFDYNHDGFLDIFKFGSTVVPSAALYKNTAGNGNNWINIKLLSCTGAADPRGAKIVLSTGGKNFVRTYSSQNSNTAGINSSEYLHFGLGLNNVIDTLTVYWPNGNVTQQIPANVNQFLLIKDGGCTLGEPMVFDLGPDTLNTCNQDTAFLLAPGGFASYLWSNGDITPDTKTGTKGWLFCTATNAAGCFVTDSIYAAFGVANIIQGDTEICLGASVVLDATPRYDCSPFGAPAPVTLTEGQNLGPNYDYIGTFNGHYYYRMLTRSTWSFAAQSAQALGGFLAVINDVAEQNFIETNVKVAGQNLWLGMYKDPADLTFKWSNCDPVTYTNWEPGSPSSVALQDFVYMRNEICPGARQWKNIIDDNSASSDPCENVVFGLIEFDPATNITYAWSSGESTPSITATPTITGSYFVQVRQNGVTCFDNINFNVINPNDLLPADSFNECKAGFTIISATPGMVSYKWNTGSLNQSILVFSNGWYSVTVETPQGCIGKDSIYVTLYNARIKTPDTTVCLGTPVYLRGPTAPFAFATEYTQDFQVGSFTPFWTTNANITYNGTKVLGPFASETISLNLLSLPAHDSVEVTFDLYIHDTWEGNCGIVGPDLFTFRNGTTNLMSNTFSNRASCTQSYPVNGSAARTGAAAIGLPKRCAPITTSTTKYTITKKFRHLTSNLDLSWIGNLTDTVDNSSKCDESWTLDNVTIKLRKAGDLNWFSDDPSQILTDHSQNITVNPTLPLTLYWVEVPVGSGFCYDTVEVTTYSGQVPFNLIFQDTTTVCNAYSVNLSLPSAYGKYTWSNGDQSRFTTAYNWGWYIGYVETEFGGCTGIDSIFVNKGPYSIAQNDTGICIGSSITLSANLHNNCNPFGAPASVGYTAGQPIPGYTYKGEYHGHHYYLADVRSNWSQAAQNALAQGGHLACINDTLEQNFIAAVVDSNAWIGLFRNANGYHNWMNCDTLTYTNWATAQAEPSASPEDYVFMIRYDCADAKMWNSFIDDDNSTTDPCLSGIYGLLEIEPDWYKYTWMPGLENTPTLTVTPTANSTYGLYVRRDQSLDIYGCNAGNVDVNIINENFEVFPDSVEKINCAGDTVMLEAAPGYSNYTWNNGETVQIATYADYVGWAYCSYDNGQCIFTDSVYVNVPPAFTTAPTFTDITCYGLNDGLASANASGGVQPYNLTWLHDGSNTINITNLSPGTYKYTIIDASGCVLSDSVVITNPDSALMLEFLTLHGVNCNNDTNAVIFPWVYGGGLPYVASWIGLSAIDTLKDIGAGLYTYTITDARGCTITRDLLLTDPDLMQVSATVTSQVVCSSDSNGVVEIYATGGTKPYYYYFNYALQNSNIISNAFKGTFKVVVMDKNGCYDSTSVTLVSLDPEKCGLMIPQGFTPNSDGKNDFFYIKGLLDYPDNELSVFNRWGETVYHKMNYANDWDGRPNKATLITSGDGIVPNDTYFYVLKTFANNKTYSGYVYLTK